VAVYFAVTDLLKTPPVFAYHVQGDPVGISERGLVQKN